MNAIVLALVLAQTPAPPAEWKAVTHAEGAFMVRMPATPSEKRQSLKTPQGPTEIRFLTLTSKEGAYVVGYTEYPVAAIPPGEEQKRLDQARDGAVQQAKGRVRSEKKILIEGFPGREFFITTETGNALKIRLVAVNNRLYQIMVIGTTTFLDSPEANRFLDSFQRMK